MRKVVASLIAGIVLGSASVGLAAQWKILSIYPKDHAEFVGHNLICTNVGYGSSVICGKADDFSPKGSSVRFRRNSVSIWPRGASRPTTFVFK